MILYAPDKAAEVIAKNQELQNVTAGNTLGRMRMGPAFNGPRDGHRAEGSGEAFTSKALKASKCHRANSREMFRPATVAFLGRDRAALQGVTQPQTFGAWRASQHVRARTRWRGSCRRRSGGAVRSRSSAECSARRHARH